jgi:hypothetical protein
LSWNSTCFGQFICPSSGVYSLYTQQWYMSYRFVDSFWAGPGWNYSKAVYKPVWHIPLLSVQWINSWWWTDELSETCKFSWQNKFVELVHLDGFIIKKKPIYSVAPKKYTHCTLILMSKECIHFFGPLCIITIKLHIQFRGPWWWAKNTRNM